MNNNEQQTSAAIIWDAPTRVFHWLLLASFAVAWLTYDDNRFLFFHVFGGYVFFGLLVFRFIWGVIGTHYARFHT
ncbi:MAG: cytochrome b, partial [Gammaproteobacteria bacterium]